jgi:hypothetical protein
VKQWIIRWQWRLSNEPAMPRDGHFIAASEIGTGCYCKKVWHLSHRGYPCSLTEERAAESDITKPTIAACEPPTSSRR